MKCGLSKAAKTRPKKQRNTPKHQPLPWQYHINVPPDEMHQSRNSPDKACSDGHGANSRRRADEQDISVDENGTVIYRQTSLNLGKPSRPEVVDIWMATPIQRP